MDRLELRTKVSSRIEKFRLDEYDLDLHLRKLSATERSQFSARAINANAGKDTPEYMDKLTKDVVAYVVAHGLVDDSGKRIYSDDEEGVIPDELPGDVLDAICDRVLVISKLKKASIEDEVKNLNPTPNSLPGSGSQECAEGGTTNDC